MGTGGKKGSRFLIAGTANGLIDDLPWDLIDYPEAGTIFDTLVTHGISWVNYHNVHPAKVLLKRLLGAPGLIALRRLAQLGRWLPGVVNAVRGNKSFTTDLYPLGLVRSIRHLRTTQRFFADAAAGTLPAVSIVDPDFGAYSEENPQDISLGESFAAAVVNAVTHGPAWESTLLLWIYDEHGGYYDHVPPPAAVPPDDVPGHNWQLTLPPWLRAVVAPLLRESVATLENKDAGPATYDRYGFRVPAVIVSPYARPDFVLNEVLDHTSVLKLIEEKWNLPPLTRRDEAAVSPLAALDLDGPGAFLSPPPLPAPKAGPLPLPDADFWARPAPGAGALGRWGAGAPVPLLMPGRLGRWGAASLPDARSVRAQLPHQHRQAHRHRLRCLGIRCIG